MQSRYFIGSFLLLLSLSAAAQNIPNSETAVPGSVSAITQPAELNTSLDPNYIRSYVPLLPMDEAIYVNSGSPASQVKQSVDYTDGFNRTFQSVVKQVAVVGGQPRHLVQLYDSRTQPVQYGFLPYSSTNEGLQTGAYQAQRDYYAGKYPDEGYTSYSRNVNTSNASVRSVTSYAPGKSQTGQGRGVVARPIAHSANQVRIWDIDANGLPVTTGYYAANELLGQEVIVPGGATGTINIASPQNRVFNDKEGRMVLKMVADSNSTSITYQSTYYVYDDMGKLRFILPPRIVKLLEDNSWVMNNAWITPLCFQYTYDAKGRLRSAQQPGEAAPTIMLYDRKDRVIMRQTPEEQSNKQWEITYYDPQGRVKATSLYVDAGGATPDAWQSQIDTWTGGTTANLLYYLSTAAGEAQYPGETAIANNTMMSYTWYDHYGITDPSNAYWNTCTSTLQFDGDLLTPDGWEAPTRGQRTNGMITGTKVRILPSLTAAAASTGDWRQSVVYYDDKGRNIYTISNDLYQGNVIHSAYGANEYDFAGRLLLSKHIVKNNNEAGSGTTQHTEWNKNIYDAATAALSATYHKVDGGNWNVLSSYQYDDMGRIQRKTLGNSGEVQDFSYNIRGQLTGINADYALTGYKGGLSRTFGEALFYDYGFSKDRYDGKVTGMIWRGSSADPLSGTSFTRNYAYGYDYDQSGRLKKADFNVQVNSGAGVTPWNNTSMDYSVSNLFYDKNGNILSMKQRGVKPGTGPVDMDDMQYIYGSENRLRAVSDAGMADYGAGDFQDVAGGSDYDYDNNGNLKKDANKHITSVSYTFFNKPSRIVYDNGNSIEYSYDAAGGKVQELVMPAGQAAKKTDYLGNVVYRGDTLQYILTGEGRTVLNGTAPGGTKEEYFVKDHLGNVRSTIDVITYLTRDYLATWEIASANLEGLIFDNLNEVRDTKPGSTDPNDASSARLNGAEADHRIGASMLVRVMAGDKISLQVNNYFENYNANDDSPVSTADMLSAVINTLAGGVGGFPGEEHNIKMVNSLFSEGNFTSFQQLVDNNYTDPAKPRAFLNYVFFDDHMKIVTQLSGAIQANGDGTWAAIGTQAPIAIPINGYMGVYLSNSSHVLTCGSCGNVFFDQLWVEVSKGNLLEENHYYPHGLPIYGLSGQTADDFKEQRHRYQGNEYIKDLGLNWMDFHARQYDPQIGRFLGVDPLASSGGQDAFSPYAAMGNAPESMIDPNGLQAQGPPAMFSGNMPIFGENGPQNGGDYGFNWALTGGINTGTSAGIGGAGSNWDPFTLFSSGFPALVQQVQARQQARTISAIIEGIVGEAAVGNGAARPGFTRDMINDAGWIIDGETNGYFHAYRWIEDPKVGYKKEGAQFNKANEKSDQSSEEMPWYPWSGRGIWGASAVGSYLSVRGEINSINMYAQGIRRGVFGNYQLVGRNLSLFKNAPMSSVTKPISNVGRWGGHLGYGLAIVGVGIDLIGVYNWTKDPNSENAVHPYKFGLNTGMSAYGLWLNPVVGAAYFGIDAFYPGGWIGASQTAAQNEANERAMTGHPLFNNSALKL